MFSSSSEKKELIEKAAEFVRNKEKSKSELIEELTLLTTRLERLEGTVEAAVLERSSPTEAVSRNQEDDRAVIENEVERRVAERLESEVEQQVQERTRGLENLMQERTEIEIERQLSERLKDKPASESSAAGDDFEQLAGDEFEQLLERRVAERTRELEAVVDELSAEVELKQLTQEELRRAEEEKHALEERLASQEQEVAATMADQARGFGGTASKVPALLWLWEEGSGLTLTNQSWLDFRGRGAEEEEGDGWMSGLHPDEVQLWKDTFQEATQSGRPFRLVHRLQRNDGSFRWMLSEAAPTRDDSKTLCFSGASLDITELKEREESRKEELDKLSKDLLERDDADSAQQGELESLRETVRQLTRDAEERAAWISNGLEGGVQTFLDDSASRLKSVLGEIEEIRGQIRSLSGRTEDLLKSVGPVVRDDEDLPKAFIRLANSLREAYGLNCSVEEDGAEPMDASARTALFLPVRELLLCLGRSRETSAPVSVSSGRVKGQIQVRVEGDLLPSDISGLESANGSPGDSRLFAARNLLEDQGGWVAVEDCEDGTVRLDFVLPVEPQAA